MADSQDEEVSSIISPPLSRGSPVPILKTSSSRSQVLDSPPPRKRLHLCYVATSDSEVSQEEALASTETITDGERPTTEPQENSSSERLTLIVDGTRFVVSRRQLVAHPDTMLGR